MARRPFDNLKPAEPPAFVSQVSPQKTEGLVIDLIVNSIIVPKLPFLNIVFIFRKMLAAGNRVS